MRKRTLARENALKILYAVDIRKEPALEYSDLFWTSNPDPGGEIREFADFLVSGVTEHKALIDSVISKSTANWEISRMATVDRNILRIATFELLFTGKIPPKVAINEAIEMAKKYGDKDSGKFVNGILDQINKTERKEPHKGENTESKV